MAGSDNSLLVKFIAVVLTIVTCYIFYHLRTSFAKDQTMAESIKVIQAASEIVKNLSEKAIPSVRNRLDELESRGRILEQTQRRQTASTESVSQPNDAELLAARRAQRGAS